MKRVVNILNRLPKELSRNFQGLQGIAKGVPVIKDKDVTMAAICLLFDAPQKSLATWTEEWR